MTLLNKISNKELAAYLDGMFSKEELAKVDSTMDIETLEILNVSRKAIEEFPTDNVISLPPWSDATANSILNTNLWQWLFWGMKAVTMMMKYMTINRIMKIRQL